MTATRKNAPKAHNLVYLNRDRGYRFVDRDPQMVELCGLISMSEMSVGEIIERIYEATGGAYSVSKSTINSWLNGKVNRPQNFGMTWVAFALGYERKWTKI